MGRPQEGFSAVYPPSRPPPAPPLSDLQSRADENQESTAYPPPPPPEISPAPSQYFSPAPSQYSYNAETTEPHGEAPPSYPPQNDNPDYPKQNPTITMSYFQGGPTYTAPGPSPPFPQPMGIGRQPVDFPPQRPAPFGPPLQFPPPSPSPNPHLPQQIPEKGIPVQPQFVPAPYVQRYGMNAGTVAWTTGLFDCMDDPQNALFTACFPCLTFGQIAEIVESGHTTCGTSGVLYGAIACLIAMPCLLSCTYRTKLRNMFDLVEAPAPDWATHFLCECCALCQEYRELKNRGIDPELGWHGNIMKNQNSQLQYAMTPPMNQNMTG